MHGDPTGGLRWRQVRPQGPSSPRILPSRWGFQVRSRCPLAPILGSLTRALAFKFLTCEPKAKATSNHFPLRASAWGFMPAFTLGPGPWPVSTINIETC